MRIHHDGVSLDVRLDGSKDGARIRSHQPMYVDERRRLLESHHG